MYDSNTHSRRVDPHGTRWLVPMLLTAAGLFATRANATTTLTVDLSSTIRPVTHAASGSLYGVIEKLPADVNALITPLHPYVFNNPASDVQQPWGDAIAIAGRLQSTGGKVSIRLADWLPGWPYKFASVTDWLDKVGQTVARKKASGLDNYYGYEIWNEPNGTWTSKSLTFNDLWKQTYVKLRQLDPEAKIIGPSISYYDATYMKNFLTFAKANDCVPDIVAWHELGSGNFAGTYQTYRALEKELGIAPLPISLNEYSGKGHITDEGRPGASAPLIAKFERFKVDSACISYWDVAHAGRLGSLMASDTAKNGGWWFYKWYGDMTGNMVETTPPAANDTTTLDGFANLDTDNQQASVLFGGTNDGTVQIVVKGFQAATSFGSKAHAVVERTPFVNRTTVVNSTITVSTADVPISANQLSVTVSGANNNDGFRLTLTPVGGPAGGSSGLGGNPGSSGAPGASGGQAAGGMSAIGGAGPDAAGGAATASGGSSTAGSSPGGGASASGGAISTAGMTSSENPDGAEQAHDASCTCRIGGAHKTPPVFAALGALGALALRIRRRRKKA